MKGEDAVPLEWKPGNVILDTYEVQRVLGEGGMGKVFLVRHRGTQSDLAVKCPKSEMFSDEAGKKDFVAITRAPSAERLIYINIYYDAVKA